MKFGIYDIIKIYTEQVNTWSTNMVLHIGTLLAIDNES